MGPLQTQYKARMHIAFMELLSFKWEACSGCSPTEPLQAEIVLKTGHFDTTHPAFRLYFDASRSSGSPIHAGSLLMGGADDWLFSFTRDPTETELVGVGDGTAVIDGAASEAPSSGECSCLALSQHADSSSMYAKGRPSSL